jgi:hypothetical protein
MVIRAIRLGTLAAMLCLAGCGQDHRGATYDAHDRGRWKPVEFEQLPLLLKTGDLFMGSDRPAAILVSSQEQLDALWQQIYPPPTSMPPSPVVDLSAHALLIVTMGGSPTGFAGGISVTRVLESEDATLVQAVQQWVGHGMTSFGDPVHPSTMVLLPRSTKRVLVDRRNEIKVYDE